jgi:hypothetical protein
LIQIVTVLEDAVLAFRKLKNGILIFDDYGWGGLYLTQKSIDAFISGYYKRINILGQEDIQFYLCKRKIDRVFLHTIFCIFKNKI